MRLLLVKEYLQCYRQLPVRMMVTKTYGTHCLNFMYSASTMAAVPLKALIC